MALNSDQDKIEKLIAEIEDHFMDNPRSLRIRNKFGETFLHTAARTNNVAVAKKVIELDSSICTLKDHDGFTPLHLAAASGHMEIVQLLCQTMPELAKIKDECDYLPIDFARTNKRESCVQFLDAYSSK